MYNNLMDTIYLDVISSQPASGLGYTSQPLGFDAVVPGSEYVILYYVKCWGHSMFMSTYIWG